MMPFSMIPTSSDLPLPARAFSCYGTTMISRIVPIVFALALAAGPGCKSMGGGMPAGQAQVTVSGVSEAQVEAKAEEVFYRHGFEFRGTGNGQMAFERAGGTMGNVLYGNWLEKDVLTRVTLFIIPKGPLTYTLRARSMAVRQSFGGDEDTQLFDIQGSRYGVILKKIAQELAEENPQ